MRLRFFSALFFVLLTVGIASSLLYNHFLHQDRMQLIDQQVRETATALLGSELGELSKVDFNTAEEIISEELGENRIGKFFILRKSNGSILYESLGAKVLPIRDVPQTPQWVTIREKGQYIRTLNLELPRFSNRTLQVGLVIGEDILSPPYLSKNTLIYIAATVLIGLLVSFFLTSLLLRPLRSLSDFLRDVTAKKGAHTLLARLPKDLFSHTKLGHKDEYNMLLNCLDDLIDRVNKGYKTSRSWSYQMAHELKTPLTIMETDLEVASRKGQVQPQLVEDLRTEIKIVSNTISAFLNWAEIENINEIKSHGDVSVASSIEDMFKRLDKTYPGRIRLNIVSDCNLKCNTHYFELFVQNILSNSLKYSFGSGWIDITIDRETLTITDHGPGIPKTVVDRLGEPFNFDGRNAKVGHGSGLGLAFVYSIANLYKWDLSLQTDTNGTKFITTFHP